MSRLPPWLASLLEEHLEELQMLWEKRLTMIDDADYELEDLQLLDERMEAHRDALQLAGDAAAPLLEEALAGGDRWAVFAAALVMLSGGDDGMEPLLSALAEAKGEQLAGLRDALCYWPSRRMIRALAPLLESPAPHVAAAAAEVAAFHGRLSAHSRTLAALLEHADPEVCAAGWRAVACVDAVSTPPPSHAT